MKWSFSGAGLVGIDGVIIDIVIVVVIVIITSSMTIALIAPVGIIINISIVISSGRR